MTPLIARVPSLMSGVVVGRRVAPRWQTGCRVGNLGTGDRAAQRTMRTKAEVSSEMLRLVSADDQVTSRGGTVTRIVSDRVNEALGLDLEGTKQTLPAQIVRRAGLQWEESCWSRGGTVTLVGLERLLQATQRLLDERTRAADEEARQVARQTALIDSGWVHAPDQALCEAVAEVVAGALPARLDGREAILQLREWGNQWRQIEWIGWWTEHVARKALIRHLGGTVGPTFLNTEFDYRLGRVFDIKTHVSAPDETRSAESVLNDVDAVEAAVVQTGAIGFVVVRGHATYDDDQATFYAWHRRLQNKQVKPRTSKSRRRKTSFIPLEVDAFLLPGIDALRSAQEMELLRIMRQGRQQSGAPRRPKYKLRLDAPVPSGVHRAVVPVTGDGAAPPPSPESPTLFDQPDGGAANGR